MCLFKQMDSVESILALGHLDDDELKIYEQVKEIFLSRFDCSLTGKEKVEDIFRLVDELMAEWLENNKITCYRGCSTCCLQLVCCSTLEMEIIVQYLKSLPRQSRRSIVQRVKKESQWLDKFVKKLYPDGLPSNRELRAGPMREAYYGERPCPFLNSTGACSIYPVRPIDCRVAKTQDPMCGRTINTPEEMPEKIGEGFKSLRFFFDQVATNLIMEEEERAYGKMQLVPLPAWAISRNFHSFFSNKQGQAKPKKKRTRLRPSISSGLRRGKGKRKRK